MHARRTHTHVCTADRCLCTHTHTRHMHTHQARVMHAAEPCCCRVCQGQQVTVCHKGVCRLGVAVLLQIACKQTEPARHDEYGVQGAGVTNNFTTLAVVIAVVISARGDCCHASVHSRPTRSHGCGSASTLPARYHTLFQGGQLLQHTAPRFPPVKIDTHRWLVASVVRPLRRLVPALIIVAAGTLLIITSVLVVGPWVTVMLVVSIKGALWGRGRGAWQHSMWSAAAALLV